ncbi:RHS repeat-associated core domain-containing protein [Chitinophaga sp. CB10]|uniref:RHS repeat domain-containing protein n=1 Tax=Chitinophaga sp. CB10 TaxID=1891659 RepID=UPI000B181B60|nr:RHS repeat-associated core domain-containing protein [Chitinophaga sp. CB10]
MKIARNLLFLALYTLTGTTAFAQHAIVIKKMLTGASGQLAKDSVVSIQDAAYFDANRAKLDTPYFLRNIVTLGIDEFSSRRLPGKFSLSAKVRIIYTTPQLTEDSVDQTLTISYDTTHPYTLRSSFTFAKAHKVSVKILEITTDATMNVLPALYLENLMEVRPVYKLSKIDDAIKSIQSNNPPYSENTDELVVSWPAVLGADVYDLEWTYVDRSALDAVKYGNPVDPKKVFQFSSSRATISGTSYNIPLMYGTEGALFYRVRAVQEKADGNRFATAWSSDFAGGFGRYDFEGHQPNLNWQSNISFAEEGKRKVVTSYFDGSLRARQTVTKDNTTQHTIVAESFYDYQGRPAVNVLPTPTVSTVMKYTPAYNRSINDAEYDKEQYDKLDLPSDIVTGRAAKMSTRFGSNQYYSPDNPDKNNPISENIPDAGGYAFTEIQYTPDNTNRPSRQGGLGAEAQLGSNREVKYLYGEPSQEDLDALFGTEAGLSSHYFMNSVIDQNGQISVSYLDMHGRTVATALAGSVRNKSLSDLDEKKEEVVTDRLSGVDKTRYKDQTLVISKTITVKTPGTYRFVYKLDPPVLKKSTCNGDSIAYVSRYDLQIQITDDVMNYRLGGQPVIKKISNYKSDTSGIAFDVGDSLVLDFSLDLEIGTYTVTKSLEVSNQVYNYYRDSVFLKGAVCTTVESEIEKQLAAQRQYPCGPDCGDCEDKTKVESDYIMDQMLADMTAPYGQYALLSDTLKTDMSIFYIGGNRPYPAYKTPSFKYLDENGNPALVLNPESGKLVDPKELTPVQFAAAFQPSWAKTLITIHPEYCRWDQYNRVLKAEQIWGKDFESEETYTGAKQKGFLNPTAGTSKDPAIARSSTITAAYNEYGKTIVNKQTIGLSMWATALMAIKCPENAGSCVSKYKTMSFAEMEQELCGADLDMVWRAFRNLYKGKREEALRAYVLGTCHEPVYAKLSAAGKKSYFLDNATAIKDAGLSPIAATDTATARKQAEQAMMTTIAKNIDSLAVKWASQLAPCQYSPTIINAIKGDLIAVCRLGGDVNHPYGASTVPPGSAGTRGPSNQGPLMKSFDDVFNKYKEQRGVTDPVICNAELITFPRPYDKQLAYSDSYSYNKPKECECTKINALNAEYNVSKLPSDVNLSGYIKRTRKVNISQSDLEVLLTACGTSTPSCDYMPKLVKLPVLFMCDVVPACASCAITDSLIAKFKGLYPGVEPTYEEETERQRQVNTLFSTFMNKNLGFRKQAWEYLQFHDSCKVTPSTGGSRVCVSNPNTRQMINVYTNGSGEDRIEDVRNFDAGYIMAGYTTGNTAGGKDGYVIRTDSKGNLIWSKTFGSEADDVFRRLITTRDGGFLAIGTTMSYCFDQGAILMVKMDPEGNIEWNKTVDFGEHGAEGSDVIETSEGNFAFAGLRKMNNSATDWVTGVLDTAGQLIWLKHYGSEAQKTRPTLLESGDTLVLAASIKADASSDVVLIKQNKHTGANLAVSQYDIGADDITTAILPVANGFKLAVLSGGAGAYINIGADGSPLDAYKVSSPDAIDPESWIISGADGDNVVAAQSTQDVWWHKLGADNSVLWSTHVQLSGNERIYKLVQSNNGTYTGVGVHDGKAMIIIGDYQGRTGCNDVAANTTNTPIVAILKEMQPQTEVFLDDRALNVVQISALGITPFVNTISCPAPDSCFYVFNRTLCGSAEPVLAVDELSLPTSCGDSLDMADTKGREIFNYRTDSIRNDFDVQYLAKAMTAASNEEFTVTYSNSEYHYTLYYYNQAGNLVKTVPPAGVKYNRSRGWLDSVAVARSRGEQLVPVHGLATEYRYNSIGVVIEQRTPDAGKSNFWYDRLGRLVFSQNSKQTAFNDYSYTLYDDIGRVTEVGQLRSLSPMVDTISRKAMSLQNWFNAASGTRNQITRTVYDVPYAGTTPELWTAHNLRNRVAWTAVYDNIADTVLGAQSAATYYDYDILGNVKSLLQEYNSKVRPDGENRFKRIDYTFDLISGKVNTVAYQVGNRDAYYHRYTYDAENRITNVETSRDSIYWEQDAYYQYYKHGPLARALIGQAQVQGVDYGYTLEGWLKGVNATVLGAANDMGRDGHTGGLSARDAYSFSLYYYNNDYTPIGTIRPFSALQVLKPLYNGNIAAMSVNLQGVGVPLTYNYSYDVLNRLKGMTVAKGLDSAMNRWTPIELPDFKESISYDPNGNILSYDRNGNNTWAGKPLAMDNLTYHYFAGTNKVARIEDLPANTGNYDNDIDDQLANNYDYDSIGNLIADNQEGISNIEWNIYGKIAGIRKDNGSVISYKYDAAGNRISKNVDGKETRYVRDASGNVMSVYVSGDNGINGGVMSQVETHIYGSSRLGIDNLITKLEGAENDLGERVSLGTLGSGFLTTFERGNKLFELSNHLGNVLATVADDKIGMGDNDTTITYYVPRILSAQDYAPFGMGLWGRGVNDGRYRYGFNGKENDNEVKGEGNQIAFEARIYDPRIGRFLSVDPLTMDYPENSPYQFAGNSPISLIDHLGMAPAGPGPSSSLMPMPVTPENLQMIWTGIKNFPFVTETGRRNRDALLDLVMPSVLGLMNAGGASVSFGGLNRPASDIGLTPEQAPAYNWATDVGVPGFAMLSLGSGGGSAPSMAVASNNTLLTTATKLSIESIVTLYSTAAHVEKNRVKGDEREADELASLKQQYPDAQIYSERFLRDANGKKVVDPLTGEGRRIDFAVVKNGLVAKLIETTSKTADKTAQIAKEARIRAAGGHYVKAPGKKGTIYNVKDILTTISRRE